MFSVCGILLALLMLLSPFAAFAQLGPRQQGGGGGGTSSGAANVLQLSDGASGFSAAGAGTFSTSLRGPLLIGGTAASSTLALRSTSGVGTSDAILFQVGNAGATEAGRITTAGSWLLTGATTVAAGGLNIGVGDNQVVFTPPVTTPTQVSVIQGSNASPYTGISPMVKMVMTRSNDGSAIVGDGSQQMTTLEIQAVGDASSKAQPVGVFSGCKNSGTVAFDTAIRPDCVGVYGVGRITGSGIGSGIGAVFVGRRDTDTGRLTGVEVAGQNYTATDGTYLSTGASATKALWVNAAGDADTGVGLSFNNPFGRQFKVGLAFGNQVNNGKTGPTVDADIQSDSLATTSLKIGGTHTYGMTVASTAGSVVFGALTSTRKFEVVYTDAVADSMVLFDQRFTTAQTTIHAQRSATLLTHTSGTTTQATGGILTATMSGSGGTVTNLAGADVKVTTTAGTVTNQHGLRVNSATISGGTVSNNNGLTINDQSGGTGNYGLRLSQTTAGTNDFALYQSSEAAKSKFFGSVLMPAPSAETIADTATITANACGGIKRISSAGTVTTNTTNTFTAPAAGNAGCVMSVYNSGAQTINLDANANFLTLAGANVALTAGCIVEVASTGASGVWVQRTAVFCVA